MHFGAVLAAYLAVGGAPVGGDFVLERNGAETWTANYCFDDVVEAFKFERPMSGDMRQNYWKAADGAFTLTYETIGRESIAVLKRKDGTAFKCGSVNLSTYTKLPEKNYLAFSGFSDGGASVYTGYYMGTAQVAGEWRPTSLRANYVPLDGNSVITRDSENLVHQFVYYGPQKLEEKNGAIAVIDPVVPAAAREVIFDVIPQVNEEMAYLFRHKQTEPYMVFMAGADLNSHDGYSVKAGTQENQINYSLSGRQVIEIAMQEPSWYAKGAAHEVIHLWQTEVWEKLGHDQPWMHEGSADALAYEVLHQTGHYTDEKYAAVWNNAENECVIGLAKSSIYMAAQTGNFQTVYHCGAVVNYLVGGVLDNNDYGAGISRFWRAMAAWPEADRKTDQSELLFFRTLTKLGVEEERQAAIREFLAVKPEEPAQALHRLKYRLGLEAKLNRRSGLFARN